MLVRAFQVGEGASLNEILSPPMARRIDLRQPQGCNAKSAAICPTKTNTPNALILISARRAAKGQKVRVGHFRRT